VTVLADPLPDDIEALHDLLRGVAAERDAALAERDVLAEQNDRLRHLLRQLQRMQFGRRSEKLDPDQLQLALEDVEGALARGAAEAEKREPQSPAARPRRRARPALRCRRICRASRW
jgi:transposase